MLRRGKAVSHIFPKYFHKQTVTEWNSSAAPPNHGPRRQHSAL